METAADCYRRAVQCDHLAKFALSDADRDVVLAASKEGPHSLLLKPAKKPRQTITRHWATGLSSE
jgi:hypothetical protein